MACAFFFRFDSNLAEIHTWHNFFRGMEVMDYGLYYGMGYGEFDGHGIWFHGDL